MGDIVITGAGVVSAIGLNWQENLQALRAGRSGVGPVRFLRTSHSEFPVGEVALPPQESGTSRTVRMGVMAVDEALRQARLNSGAGMALISGTTVGGMDVFEDAYPDRAAQALPQQDCGASSLLIAQAFPGRFSLVTTPSTACSSALNAIILGVRLLQEGQADVVVAGGSECLTRYHLNGFKSLMILDECPCRPFDATRAGLNLGEGAAYVVLERRADALRRGATPLACVSGCGNACDAFHQTASSPDGEGAFLAMTRALADARLRPEEIDYVNAHGTATPNNDASESAALRRVFGDVLPPVSSTKPFTGHTTSASGAIEAVFCLMALQHQFLPVQLHWQEPDESCVRPVLDSRPVRPLRHVLCNAFGFGGNDSAIVLSAVDENISAASSPARSKREIYIRSLAQISAQKPLNDDWLEHPDLFHGETVVPAQDPAFRQWLNPMKSRRWDKLLKRAVVTAQEALRRGGVEHPDAIVTGTAMGCLESTSALLGALAREGEQVSQPTHFMQSTHNTIGSLIAIQTASHGYNATYSQRALSLDHALLDAALQLRQGRLSNALVCAGDQLIDEWVQLLNQTGSVPQPFVSEASLAMLLTTQPDDAVCRIEVSATPIAVSTHCVTVGGPDATCSFAPLFGAQPALDVYGAAVCLRAGRFPAMLRTDGVKKDIIASKVLITHCDGPNKSFILLSRI